MTRPKAPTPAMCITTTIDGVACTLERLSGGSIRVTHAGPAYNAMHGAGTEGVVSYEVHPVQREQYVFLNDLFPAGERASEAEMQTAARPWWSLSAGQGGRE